MENTIIRINSENVKTFCFGSIIESFIGPIRSMYILLTTQNYLGFINYLIFEITNFASPYPYIIFYCMLIHNKKIN